MSTDAPAATGASETSDRHHASVDLKAFAGGEFERLTEKEPCTSVIAYHSLGLAVSNFAASIEFFTKIGFTLLPEKTTEAYTVLRNGGGLELQLLLSDVPVQDNVNILMDAPEKYPGHTHASFWVPNVVAVRGTYSVSLLSDCVIGPLVVMFRCRLSDYLYGTYYVADQ
jgi:hypothetical protein